MGFHVTIFQEVYINQIKNLSYCCIWMIKINIYFCSENWKNFQKVEETVHHTKTSVNSIFVGPTCDILDIHLYANSLLT